MRMNVRVVYEYSYDVNPADYVEKAGDDPAALPVREILNIDSVNFKDDPIGSLDGRDPVFLEMKLLSDAGDVLDETTTYFFD